QTEIDNWVSQLPAAGQAGVANAILRSHEAHLRLVDGYYSYFLGRFANGSEEQVWVTQLDQGATAEQVAARILGSTEFANRANARFDVWTIAVLVSGSSEYFAGA